MRIRVALAVLCVAVACSGGDQQRDTGSDAGLDATEVGLDATHDVDSDASHDTSPDAPLAPDDPGWVRLPGFPDECYVERARQPEAVLAFHWEPCRDALPHCEMIIVDRSVADLFGVAGLPGRGADHGFVWELSDAANHRAIETLIHDDAVVAAWRTNAASASGSYCGVQLPGDATGVAFDGWHTVGPALANDHVGLAAWADLGALDEPWWLVSPAVVANGDFLEAPAGSSLAFAAMTTTGHIVAAEPPNGAVIGDGAEPVVVGHSVLWNWGDDTGASGIHLGGLAITEREIYRAPSGTHAYGVRADGTWIVWHGGADDPTGVHYPLNELWAAPYDETGPLDARRTWTDLVNNGRWGTLGDGMFAYDGFDMVAMGPSIYVIRLSDGARYEYTLPYDATPGAATWGLASDPAWVTRDEVAFPAARSEGAERFRTVLRVDLTALTPEPLP